MSVQFNPTPRFLFIGFRPMAWLMLLMYLAFIFYASITPLGHWAFPSNPYPHDLIYGWQNKIHLFDIGQNLLFYLPLGILVALLGYEKFKLGKIFLIGLSLSALISLSMESLQSFHVTRVSSILDVALNTLSGAFGVIIGVLLFQGKQFWQQVYNTIFQGDKHPFFIFLASCTIFCWIGYHLYPYLPTLQYSHIKYGISPLIKGLENPSLFQEQHFVKYFIQGICLYLASCLLFKPYFRLLGLGLIIFIVLSIKVAVVSRYVTLEAISGLGAALLCTSMLFLITRICITLLKK